MILACSYRLPAHLKIDAVSVMNLTVSAAFGMCGLGRRRRHGGGRLRKNGTRRALSRGLRTSLRAGYRTVARASLCFWINSASRINTLRFRCLRRRWPGWTLRFRTALGISMGRAGGSTKTVRAARLGRGHNPWLQMCVPPPSWTSPKPQTCRELSRLKRTY